MLAELADGSGDLREVRAAADAGDAAARLAVAVRSRPWPPMNGIDALVFTAGVGEHQPPVRAEAAAGLGFLGVAIDPDRNTAAAGDTDISAASASVRTLVITAREDIEIARQLRTALLTSA